MPLTPEDVLNKTFGTTQFRRGYDEREVDDFLDEVVAAMRRLTADLENCRNAKITDSAPIPVTVDTGEWQARLDREVALRQEAERALGELQERHRREADERIAAASAAGDQERAAIDQRISDMTTRADEAERAARERIEAANARADEAENAARQRTTEAESSERALQERIAEPRGQGRRCPDRRAGGATAPVADGRLGLDRLGPARPRRACCRGPEHPRPARHRGTVPARRTVGHGATDPRREDR
jgi:DivIVA domain-containing protein